MLIWFHVHRYSINSSVGLKTIESMIEADAKVLAIEAGRTLLVDQKEVVALADKHGIAIVAKESGEE